MVMHYFGKFVLISGPSGPWGDLISLSLDYTKGLEQFLKASGLSESYIYDYLFLKKLVLISGPWVPWGPDICLSRSYWKNSWELRDIQDLICMAIYFFKRLFEYRDLQDL